MKPSKSSSRSSSCIGTLSHESRNNKLKYDGKSIRCVSPSRKPITTLRSLKDSLSKTKKNIKRGFSPKQFNSNNKTHEYDWAPEGLILDKFDQDLLEENTEADSLFQMMINQTIMKTM